MAVNAVFRKQVSTTKVFKSSGGDGAITFASLANSTSDSTGARQSTKVDFQSLGSGSNTAARKYSVTALFSWVTTAPTSGNLLELYFNPSSSATAGTDNQGGCAGTDSGYTGNTNDISVASKALVYIGSFPVSAVAADQSAWIGFIDLPSRYGSIVVWNKSGRLLNSSEGNMAVTFTPIEDTGDAS